MQLSKKLEQQLNIYLSAAHEANNAAYKEALVAKRELACGNTDAAMDHFQASLQASERAKARQLEWVKKFQGCHKACLAS